MYSESHQKGIPINIYKVKELHITFPNLSTRWPLGDVAVILNK